MPPTGAPRTATTPFVLRPGAQLIERTEEGLIVSFGGLKVSDISEAAGRGLCFTIYGPAGSGKTTLCATAVRSVAWGAPGVILDADGGARSIAEETGLQWISVLDFAHLTGFHQAAIAAGPSNFPWKTVIVDNLSEIAEIRRREITAADHDITSQREFGALTTDMKDVIRDYRDLARTFNINVFFVAWDLAEKNEAGATIARRVNFSPKLASQVPGIVDLIGYLEVLDNSPHFSRVLHLEATPKLDSKWRVSPNEVSAKIPKQLINPTMDVLLDTLRGGENFPAGRFAALPSSSTK